MGEGLGVGIPQDAQVTSAAHFTWWRRARLLGTGCRFAYGVRERFEIVMARLQGVRIGCEPDHLPAAGRYQPFGMLAAQVVAVRFGIGGQRP